MPPRKNIETLESLCISAFCRWFYDASFPYLVRLSEDVIYPLEKNVKQQTKTSSEDLQGSNILSSYSVTDDGKLFLNNFKRSYYDTVPPLFHDAILNRYISQMACYFGQLTQDRIIPTERDGIKIVFLHELYFCVSSVLCLITPKTTVLDLTSLTHIAKRWLIFGISYDMKNVSDFYYEVFPALLCTSNNLDSLETLTLPHFVDDRLIKHISLRCPNMKHLTLRCAFDCKEYDRAAYSYFSIPLLFGISELRNPRNGEDERNDGAQVFQGKTVQQFDPFQSFGCKYLKTLCLPVGTEVVDCHIVDMFMSLLIFIKNLEYFVGFPILYILNLDSNIMEEKYALKNFHHGAYPLPSWISFVHCDHEVDDEELNLMSVYLKAFEVEEIRIYATPEEVKIVLEAFPNVRDVMLFTDDFDLHKNYLTNLVRLDINIGYQTEWEILVALSSSCPELEELTLRSFSLEVENYIAGPVTFPKLLKLRLYEQGDVKENAFSLLTLTCPLLTEIILWFKLGNEAESNLSLLNDSIIETFAQMHPSLEKFIYRLNNFFKVNIRECSPLSYKSVNYLLKYCPNLKVIGNLDSFSIAPEEKQNLQSKIKLNNWELEFAN